MLRRVCTAAISAGSLLLLVATVGEPAASASSEPGTVFTWVGSEPNDGDGHSWTDPRNWDPQAVPRHGDSVSVAAFTGSTCTTRVDHVPAFVHLRDFSLLAIAGCSATVHGGAIAVADSFSWSGGTLDSALTLNRTATGLVEADDSSAALRLGRLLDVQGLLEVLVRPLAVQVAPGAEIRVSSGGDLRLDPGSTIHAVDCCQTPSLLEVGVGGTVSVPADAQRIGPATVAGLLLRDERGTTSVAPGATLRIADGPRGVINTAAFQGGGTVILASPTDAENTSTFTDGSRLVLAPGGTIDGPTAGFLGDGFFTWRGGHLSGLDLGFALSGFTVAGATRKVIDEDAGFPSNVEVFNDTILSAGTPERHNLLDTAGGSLEVFFSTITVRNDVEVTGDGSLTSSQGNYVIDPGAGGTVFLDEDTFLPVSQELDVLSGTLLSKGTYEQALTGASTVVEKGAVIKAPVASHPLVIEQGSLTGQGIVDGSVVSTGGTFEPYNSGSPIPLRITGSYTQQAGASLLLDLAGDGRPLHIGGVVEIHGTVSYDNQAGYLPPTGTKRTILSASGGLTWTPDCEQTHADEDGHWISKQIGNRVVATFSAGTGDSC